jgi:NADPH-dependent 2,4-dienoyl-CoA reductase/sulfur reductase-like enzyme
MEGLHYFRNLDDFERIRAKTGKNKTAVVIGGGFIGSEIAAALNINDVKVTMIFPGNSICERVFPAEFALAVQEHFLKNGVTIINGAKPVSFSRHNGQLITETEKGQALLSDLVIVGAGIAPEIKLASTGGLKITNGIAVNERLETSKTDIYAAGDNACFPCQALNKTIRVEHWDNAINQGRLAGRNMAGASEPYLYLPYFYSDLFNYGYEAVGEVDSRLQTITDWQYENRKGVIYYLENNRIRGVLLCDIWDKIPEARKLIEQKTLITEIKLPGNLWN